jgi:hypothetical protein
MINRNLRTYLSGDKASKADREVRYKVRLQSIPSLVVLITQSLLLALLFVLCQVYYCRHSLTCGHSVPALNTHHHSVFISHSTSLEEKLAINKRCFLHMCVVSLLDVCDLCQ